MEPARAKVTENIPVNNRYEILHDEVGDEPSLSLVGGLLN